MILAGTTLYDGIQNGEIRLAESPDWLSQRPVYKLPRGNARQQVEDKALDTIALSWLLADADRKGIVVGVPGANTFKDHEVRWFTGRCVHLCYDHDAPGQSGAAKAYRMLAPVAKTILTLQWPTDLRAGYDLRDYAAFREDI